MAPKDVYQDDDRLTSFLDGLIASANEENSSKRNPVVNLSSNQADTIFTARHLHEGIHATNDVLSEGGQCVPLPTLTADKDNIADVLASALTAIVRLSRCCKANANLRIDAERTKQATQAHVAELSRLLRTSKDNAEKKAFVLASMRSTLSETETKHKNRVRKLTAECAGLKARLANAAHRENHLVMEAGQRERQLGMLQKRVHSLMANSKKLSIEPVVTSSMGRLPRAKYEAFGDGSEDDLDFDEVAENGALGMVLEENYVMRGAVRAVHGELDDFFVQYPKAFSFLYPSEGAGDEDKDEKSENEEIENEVPGMGPSEERMLLPFEMIRDEFEVNLERKLDAVRTALKSMR